MLTNKILEAVAKGYQVRFTGVRIGSRACISVRVTDYVGIGKASREEEVTVTNGELVYCEGGPTAGLTHMVERAAFALNKPPQETI